MLNYDFFIEIGEKMSYINFQKNRQNIMKNNKLLASKNLFIIENG